MKNVYSCKETDLEEEEASKLFSFLLLSFYKEFSKIYKNQLLLISDIVLLPKVSQTPFNRHLT